MNPQPQQMPQASDRARLRIGILGDRGIPARYGGFSTLVEEISTRLVADHACDVTVYCRPAYYEERPARFKGVRLVYVPAPGGKLFESLVHSGLSSFHALTQRFDAVLFVDPGNAPFLPLLRLGGLPVALHTDGIGWKRRKWGRVTIAYYRWSEGFSARWASRLVADAWAMRDYYRDQYGTDSSFIPYGSQVGAPPSEAGLEKFGLAARGYYLYVARLEPDNNADIIIREYLASGVSRPLIVVGSARYPGAYSRSLDAMADDRVRFVGSVYDDAMLNGLYANAYAYLHGHEVGGTNPSLLRAMNGGRPCVAIDVVFTREVLADAGLFFAREDGALARQLRELDAAPAKADELGRQNKARASSQYRWDAVTDGYATLFHRLTEARRRREPVGELSPEYRPHEFT